MTSKLDPRTEYDQSVFRRLGVMTIVWILLLVFAGVALVVYGDFLVDLFV